MPSEEFLDAERRIDEVLADVLQGIDTPDFEYQQPKEVQFYLLVDQAGGHLNARLRLLPQVAAAKLQGHNTLEQLQRDAHFHKLCVGRIWLMVKALGYEEPAFRAALDGHLSRVIAQEQRR